MSAERIKNLATGDSIEFIQTDHGTQGKISEFIMTLAPGSSWARRPRHFHPIQTETFKVISGELHLTAGKNKYVLKEEDDKVIVEPFTLHSFWNESDKEISFQAEIYPPVNIEKGIRLTYKLAEEGKVNKRNIPYNPMYSLILMEYFDSYFAVIPWKLQRLLFRSGAKFARLLGYKLN